MLGIILDILSLDDFHGIAEEIEIAKGKNELPLTLKKKWKQVKRAKKWRQR